MSAKTAKVAAIDDTAAKLGAAVVAAQNAVTQANDALAAIDAEIKRLTERVHEINHEPPSMDEVVAYFTAILKRQGEIWRKSAASTMRHATVPRSLIAMDGITGYNDCGEEVWEESRPNLDRVPDHRDKSNILHTTDINGNAVMPFVLAGLFDDLLVPRVEQWLRTDFAEVFPAKPIMPLAERPAAVRAIRAQIDDLKDKRADIERKLSGLIPPPAPVARGPSVTQVE